MSCVTIRVRHCTLLLVPFVLVLVAGCGGGATVSGKVTTGSTPLTTGTVIFKPNKAKGNSSTQEAIGEIDPQGNYTLKAGGNAKIPPGWYKVVVTANEPPSTDPAKMAQGGKSLINIKYNSEETSGLEKEVVASPAAGAYDLPLQP